MSRQTAARALALFAVSLLVYLANGEVLPGNDAKANAYTPASLLGAGELAFSPSRFPFMFRWQLSDEKGTVFVRFSAVKTGDFKLEAPGGQRAGYDAVRDMGRVLPMMAERS